MTTPLEALLHRLARRALLAEPAEGSGLRSGQGASPLIGPPTDWPSKDGIPLLPVLSVATEELPFVPDFLAEASSVSVFIVPNGYEHVAEDGSLVVWRDNRAGESGESGTFIPLRFREVVDYPCQAALRQALAERPQLLDTLDELDDELDESFPCHDGIKLGGYPSLIQETAFLKSLDPDFQIQLDSTEFHSFGDSGMGYVYSGLSAIIWEST